MSGKRKWWMHFQLVPIVIGGAKFSRYSDPREGAQLNFEDVSWGSVEMLRNALVESILLSCDPSILLRSDLLQNCRQDDEFRPFCCVSLPSYSLGSDATLQLSIIHLILPCRASYVCSSIQL